MSRGKPTRNEIVQGTMAWGIPPHWARMISTSGLSLPSKRLLHHKGTTKGAEIEQTAGASSSSAVISQRCFLQEL